MRKYGKARSIMDKEAHKKLMMEMFTKSKEEVNEMFNSGIFNEIVKGYMAVTLDNCNMEHDKVMECLGELDKMFDEMTAGEVREFYKKY